MSQHAVRGNTYDCDIIGLKSATPEKWKKKDQQSICNKMMYGVEETKQNSNNYK